MNPDELREHLIGKPAVAEETPFAPDVLVYKVKGKMFATLGFEIDEGVEVGTDHDAILPGYHMNKRHWNTLVLDGSLKPKLVSELCDHSYALVVAKLPKRDREGLSWKVM